jgi:cellulose synthase/poly-beta-1,6-N-acetylglucosamine synthase-like glycosyltransferase
MTLAEFASNYFWCWAIVFLMLIVVTALFARWLARPRLVPSLDEPWPKAAILVPLRGADGQLSETFRKLLAQDYPDFEVRVVVDSPTDPAIEVAQPFAERDPRFHVTSIRRKLSTCSPQCSALKQAAGDLSHDIDVVVTIDGDVQTHPTWLRELVAPLRDPRVGASFGNRWFLPPDAGWGSMVRYLWIAASIMPMAFLRFPWGGTFAIRRQTLFDCGLFYLWSTIMAHDAPATDLLRNIGLKTRFVPSLMMVNRERCGMRFCKEFIKRQLTWTRFYNGSFWPVTLTAILLSGLWIFWAALLATAILRGDFPAIGWLVALVLLNGVMLSAACFALELAVRSIVRRRGLSALRYTPSFALRLPIAVLVAQFVHLAAISESILRRTVTWRGVTYHFDDPRNVRIIADDTAAVRLAQAEADISL